MSDISEQNCISQEVGVVYSCDCLGGCDSHGESPTPIPCGACEESKSNSHQTTDGMNYNCYGCSPSGSLLCDTLHLFPNGDNPALVISSGGRCGQSSAKFASCSTGVYALEINGVDYVYTNDQDGWSAAGSGQVYCWNNPYCSGQLGHVFSYNPPYMCPDFAEAPFTCLACYGSECGCLPYTTKGNLFVGNIPNQTVTCNCQGDCHPQYPGAPNCCGE